MPQLKQAIPKYRKHRASGQAIVTLGGKDFYLGPHGCQTSKDQYDRLIAEWLAGGRQLPQPTHEGLFLAELIVAYLRYARGYYVRPDGTRTDEVRLIEQAVAHARRLYGRQLAADFGPRKLKAVRQSMIDADWCRSHVNKQIGRIKRMFRWGTEEEHVPANVFHGLQAVTGLKANRTKARENAPVRPVDDATINQTLAVLGPVVADMVRFQRLTGCRPEEVCILRPCDIDRSGEIWIYRPATHKTQHQGRRRSIVIGPQAQDILRSYLLRPKAWFCFSPQESEQKRRDLAHAARKTPLSHGNTPGSNRLTTPKRKAADRYTRDSYRRAVYRAVEKINRIRRKKDQHAELLEKWSPNRLRHSTATAIRKRFGLEAAQVILGHAAADVTQIYAERDLDKAIEVAKQVG